MENNALDRKSIKDKIKETNDSMDKMAEQIDEKMLSNF